MRRKFAANLAILFAANLLVKPFWIFGIDRVVQNKIGAAEYGTYFAVFNYSFLLSVILDFGINNFNNRAISRNRSRLSEYLLNMMMLKFFLSLVYFSLTFLTASATGFSEKQMTMLFFLAINQILLSAILYFRSNIAAMQQFKSDSFISVLDRLLTILFCLVLLYHSSFADSFNIMWFIYAQTTALGITALVALGFIIVRSSIIIKIWQLKFTRLILLQAFPFALLSLLMGVYYRIDGVMIERMLGERGALEAGIYAASFRLLDALNMFGYLFATLLLPMFAAMIRKSESVIDLTKFGAGLMFAMAVTAGVNCFFFRHEIMHVLYSNSDAYWAEIFGWLMLNFIPMSSIYIFGTLLTANGSLKALNIIALSGALLNVFLNLFLIPAKGALGATIATLITQFFVAAVHVFFAEKTFAFGYSIKDVLKLVAFLSGTFLTAYLSFQLPFGWMINLLTALTASGLFSISIGLVPLGKFLQILKHKSAT
jgi:O-antigen/teichoic acid export membrane protein